MIGKGKPSKPKLTATTGQPLRFEAKVSNHGKEEARNTRVSLSVNGETPSDELQKELVNWVRKEIGPIASPDLIQFAPGLPKTRSGKIMRRILRKIAENDFSNLGDTSTLADPAVVDDLVRNRANKS